MAMIAIAHDTDDATMAFNAHKEVARYIKPQLKAIEHSTGAGGVNLIWDTGVPGWGKNETKG